MNKGFISIVLIIGISAITSFGIIKYVPISWFTSNDNLGTSVTTISTATKFSDFPGIYNTDMAALNAGKIEISTTTLPLLTTLTGVTSVGALSSGSLTTGFTAVPVALNGTGTTSPMAYRVMLGNGAYGLTVASSTGTSGQFLTSGGAGVSPSWTTSAVDQTDNYNWTGTTRIKTLHASSTVYLNGIDYSFPATEGASSTMLTTNGTGALTWNNPDRQLLVSTTTANNMLVATTTFAAAQDLVVKVFFAGKAAADEIEMRFNNDSGSNYGYTRMIYPRGQAPQTVSATDAIVLENGATTSPMSLTININNQTSVRKLLDWNGASNNSGANAPKLQTGMGVWNNTSAQITSIRFYSQQTITAGTIISVYGRK